jgi:hypothetical protein
MAVYQQSLIQFTPALRILGEPITRPSMSDDSDKDADLDMKLVLIGITGEGTDTLDVMAQMVLKELSVGPDPTFALVGEMPAVAKRTKFCSV